PVSVNPSRGWLASANQELLDAGAGPYFGSNFYPPERSQRLNRLLFNEEEATLSSSWDIMRDSYSRHAARALPLLLRHLSLPDSADAAVVAAAAEAPDDSSALSAPEATVAPDVQAKVNPRDSLRRAAGDLLRAWDYRYTAAASAPVLFELWWKAFYRAAWDDE